MKNIIFYLETKINILSLDALEQMKLHIQVIL